MHRNTAFLHRHWRAKDSLVDSKDYSKQLFFNFSKTSLMLTMCSREVELLVAGMLLVHLWMSLPVAWYW